MAGMAGMAGVAGTAPAAAPAAAGVEAVDVARQAGVSQVNKSWDAATVDYNRDGRQDVWIGFHAQRGKLYQNRGNGRYRWVARHAWPKHNRAGRIIDRHACDWADVDRNGLPDAYCSTGRFVHNLVKRGRDNELWLQVRRGRFREVGTHWKVGDACGRGRFVAFLRANGDRWPDLFLGNDVQRRRPQDPCNRAGTRLPNERPKLFVNQRGRGFRYAPRMLRAPAGAGGRCAEVLDYDGDRWADLLTCRKYDQSPRLFRNQRGRGFVDVTHAHRLYGRVTDAAVADLDGDRDPDLLTSNVHGFGYRLNVGGLFSPGVWIDRVEQGQGRSVAAGDADGDGDVDVYGMVGLGGRQNPDDVVYLNDGLTFSEVDVPSADGAASEVTRLDRLGNGRAEFLALNGFGQYLTGPVQVIGVDVE